MESESLNNFIPLFPLSGKAMPKIELRPRVVFDKKGRFVLPKLVRDECKIHEGTVAEVEVYEHNKVVLTILGGGENG